MNERVLAWLKDNKGKTFKSPRENAFGKKTYFIKITEINEGLERIKIEFVGGTPALPLFFWMFDRALKFIECNKDRTVRIGAKVRRPFDSDTVEGKIWEGPIPDPKPFPYKAAPHVCDILVLGQLSEYQKTENPDTGRTVQGIRYVGQPYKPSGRDLLDTTDEKEDFIRRFKEAIIKWTKKNNNKIVSGRLRYSWRKMPTSQCVRKRNEVSKAIIMSRIMNGGAVDLDTLDKVTMWGFDRKFPMRNSKKVLKITKKAFACLDKGKLKEATMTLLNMEGVGISRASKILGLFDQENLCIYDSRVGKALEDLKYENRTIIPCPPGYGRDGDQGLNDDAWAENYQRLIWTLEIVRDYLNEKGHTYRLADIEMALFMIGK